MHVVKQIFPTIFQTIYSTKLNIIYWGGFGCGYGRFGPFDRNN